MTALFKPIGWFSLCLFLVACGFHLRGHIEIPDSMRTAYVQSQVDDPFIQQVRTRLEQYGIEVTHTPEQASSLLSILNLSHHSSVSSVSSSTNTRQYTLVYVLSFDFFVQGKALLRHQAVRSSRTLTVDANRILGSDDEELTLKQEMQQDLLRKLMYRLTAAIKSQSRQPT